MTLYKGKLYREAKKKVPRLFARAEELRNECYATKSPTGGLELVQSIFEEATAAFGEYPADAVWLAYEDTMIACLDLLASVEKWLKERGMSESELEAIRELTRLYGASANQLKVRSLVPQAPKQ